MTKELLKKSGRAGKAWRADGGFTLIEVVLALVILVSIFGFSILYYQTAQVKSDLYGQLRVFASYARLAQSSAESGKDGGDHGLHLESDKYTVFVGNVYSPSDVKNFVVALPPAIKIQNINLNSGGSDVLFSSPNGATDNYGGLDFVADDIEQIIHITISQVGAINY